MSMVSHDRNPRLAGGVLLADTYLLGALISRGSMGEIFEATHARLPGRFAVKMLAPELAGNKEAFARFCREAEIMSELRHPNVVQIFDFNTAPDERPYFVMEYLQGRDLETTLAASGHLALPVAVRVVEAVASALAAAHTHGIVHRDLKPANIFLAAVEGQPDEVIKVLDFGISKVRQSTTLSSRPTELLGTPAYMSPEQVRGRTDQIDGRTDQFALGAIAYRMLTGRDAFDGPAIATLLHQVVNEAPPPLSRYLPSWDTVPLQAVLDRALAKNPADRWGGMMELARAFAAAAEATRLPPASGPVLLELSPAAPARAPAAPVRAPADLHLSRARLLVSQETFELTPTGRAGPAGPDSLAVELPGGGLAGSPSRGGEAALDEEPLEVPRTRYRGIAAGAFALAVAGVMLATGWYHKIPAAVPWVRQTLATWVGPALAPGGLPAARAAEAPLALAPAAPAVSPNVAGDAPAAADPHALAGATATSEPPAEPAAVDPSPGPAPAAREELAGPAPRHHHHAGPSPGDHPGSVELAPRPPSQGISPPGESTGFAIAAPTMPPDTSARDLAPATQHERPAPPPARATGDEPLPPAFP
jgi:eukaryotic-like serine/threonine-protein kinase